MNRRNFLRSSLIAGAVSSCLRVPLLADEGKAGRKASSSEVGYKLSLDSPARRFDGKESFCHPRVGIVPGAGKDGLPRAVMTMNTVDLTGMDVYRAMYGLSTDDLGQTWSEPERVPELCYRMETIEGEERPVACSDFWPMWHKKTKTLLGTGHTVAYMPDWKVVNRRPRSSTYATYDAQKGLWSAWKKLPMPDEPGFFRAGAGCTQRYDLADGTVLLPIYFKELDAPARTTVLRCRFDGQDLQYLDHGQEIGIEETDSRGLGEPSLTKFGETFYLTLRNDKRGYVTRGKDGQEFEPIRPWKFDDGSDLGNYNTQQHWVTHSEGLFLVYTRRGANNDHVFRHRAPLFIAEVDPEKLVVLRETERELMPNRGARYGNFGVTDVSPDETWVTDAEWMQPKGVEKYGSDGSVWLARIHWDRPNRLF